MESIEGLAGKLPNYIHIKLLGNYYHLYMENPKDVIEDTFYITDEDDDASTAMLDDAVDD